MFCCILISFACYATCIIGKVSKLYLHVCNVSLYTIHVGKVLQVITVLLLTQHV